MLQAIRTPPVSTSATTWQQWDGSHQNLSQLCSMQRQADGRSVRSLVPPVASRGALVVPTMEHPHGRRNHLGSMEAMSALRFLTARAILFTRLSEHLWSEHPQQPGSDGTPLTSIQAGRVLASCRARRGRASFTATTGRLEGSCQSVC